MYFLCLLAIVYFQFALLRITNVKDILQEVFVFQRYGGSNTFTLFLVLEHCFETLVHLIEGVALEICIEGQNVLVKDSVEVYLGQRRLTLLIAAHCLTRMWLAPLLGHLLGNNLFGLDSIPVIPGILRQLVSAFDLLVLVCRSHIRA